VDALQADILLVEEYLLEALCFDLTVESPHAYLVDLFSVAPDERVVQDYAWTIAHDSFVYRPVFDSPVLMEAIIDIVHLYAFFSLLV